jgi:hypothetical protein
MRALTSKMIKVPLYNMVLERIDYRIIVPNNLLNDENPLSDKRREARLGARANARRGARGLCPFYQTTNNCFNNRYLTII